MNKWEAQGFGSAPFVCIGMFQMPNKETATMQDYQALPRMTRGGAGSCHVCGTGIVYNYMIRDARGDTFVVGCDCVGKTGDEILKRQMKEAKRTYRNAEQIAAALKAREEREAARKIAAEAIKVQYGDLFDRADALNQPWIDDIIGSCLKWGSISEKQIAALENAIERDAIEKARKNEFFGAVGERVQLTLTVDRTIKIREANYMMGACYLIIMRDAEGRTFTYIGNSNVIPGDGETVTIKAGIKEHTVYEGVNQTVIQRPTEVKAKAPKVKSDL